MLTHVKILFLLTFAGGIQSVNGTQNATDSVLGATAFSKLNEIIKNYDRKIRPGTGGPATHVQVEMKVVTFGPINEAAQKYKLDIFFRQWWLDPTLTGALNATLTMALDPASIFWKPDTYFVNAQDPTFQFVTKEAMRVVIQPDGKIYHSARIALEASCPMDFSMYPVDVQVCPLVIESYSYTTEDVYYTWYESVGNKRKTEGVEWFASDGPVFKLNKVSSLQKQISNNSKGAFSSLTVNFHLARRHGYYVWNVFLPGSFLVVMTWVNFWIPPWAYPARVTVCVTSFLSTLLVMSTAGNPLGRVSYIKAIDYFLMGNAFFVLSSLLEYILVLHSWWNINFDCFKKKKKIDNKQSNLGQINENCEYDNNQNGVESNSSSFQVEECSENGGRNGFHGKKRMSGDFFQRKTNGNRGGIKARRDSTVLAMKQFQEKHSLTKEQSKKSHPLDVISRFVFPIAYITFLLTYCGYFKLF